MRLTMLAIALAGVLALACTDAKAPTAPAVSGELASLSDDASHGGDSRRCGERVRGERDDRSVNEECAGTLELAAIRGMKCLVTASHEPDDDHGPGVGTDLNPGRTEDRGEHGEHGEHERDADDDHARCQHDDEHGTGIADWPISLTGTDDEGKSVSLTTATGAEGRYAFNDLRPGTYTVCEGVKAGFVQVFPSAGASCPGPTFGYEIALHAGRVARHRDFGNSPGGPPPPALGSIQGTVLLAGTTVGLSGWVITLYDANGTLLTQVTTDANGRYVFANLSAGTYRVCEQLPAGVTPDMVRSPAATDPGTTACPGNGTIGYTITITAAGEVLTGKDFINAIAG